MKQEKNTCGSSNLCRWCFVLSFVQFIRWYWTTEDMNQNTSLYKFEIPHVCFVLVLLLFAEKFLRTEDIFDQLWYEKSNIDQCPLHRVFFQRNLRIEVIACLHWKKTFIAGTVTKQISQAAGKSFLRVSFVMQKNRILSNVFCLWTLTPPYSV